MFVAGLKESGCFRVVDIDQFWDAMRRTGRLDSASREFGVNKVINLSINKVVLSKSSGVPLFGGGKFQFARLGLGFAIVDPYTFEILYENNLENGFRAYSEYSSWELFGAGGKTKFSNEWNWSKSSKSSELDAIARRMVIESVNQIANLLAKDKIIENPVLPEEDNRF
jgi:curli biogenesis system outer membrane secretion channel CsgG